MGVLRVLVTIQEEKIEAGGHITTVVPVPKDHFCATKGVELDGPREIVRSPDPPLVPERMTMRKPRNRSDPGRVGI